jgi:NAD(P)-dependent dehydrogenase (short-subunit alcohol dehydrogenase family)
MATLDRTRIARRATGRTALVTGGASGIGRATVERLAYEGANVVIADLQTAAAEELRARLKADGCENVCVAACDVSEESQIVAAVELARHTYGGLDILVNVAGVSSPSPLRQTATEMDLQEFRRVLSVNLEGTFLFVKHALPLMIDKRFGRIVNVASTAAVMTSNRTTPAYSSSKAAIAGLTRQLVYAYSRFGITSNSVCPGHIKTPLSLRLGKEALEARERIIPMGRIGDPEDVASAIAFLSSDEASFITGQMLVIDGGQTSVINYAESHE